jgi:hypothetical protein
MMAREKRSIIRPVLPKREKKPNTKLIFSKIVYIMEQGDEVGSVGFNTRLGVQSTV